MKNFVKALDKDGDAIRCLHNKFSKLSDGKLKEGIFIGPQIREIIKDEGFESVLNADELRAWRSFKVVVKEFLGNIRNENAENFVNEMLESFKNIGVHMSLKIHILHSHFDLFPENLGAVSDEQGERFHQDIAIFEKRYQGHNNAAMMGDYCWFLKRESNVNYKRISRSSKHFSK